LSDSQSRQLTLIGWKSKRMLMLGIEPRIFSV
jgi:hypothetical protein